MFNHLITSPIARFTPPEVRNEVLHKLGAEVIGRSEQGRDILGLVLGSGPLHISLISGNHADEPVGAETLWRLAQYLHADPLDRFTFIIIPHTNPDGEAANLPWINRWPDAQACQQLLARDKPGRDMEFGFPDAQHPLRDMRPENRAVADFLKAHAPYAMHLSLHGMTTCSGAWHLIHRLWVNRTAELRKRYAAAVQQAGLGFFDWDRKGDKGFWYIEPGFATTPESGAMRDYFLARNDPQTAAKFALSSMEYIRGLGGDPLCMVTELPLFIVLSPPPEGEGREGVPMTTAHAQPVPIGAAVRLQLVVIGLGLDLVSRATQPGGK